MDITNTEFLWKDADSNVGNCPSISKAAADGRPGYLLAGKPVSEGTRAAIPEIGDGEIALWVPANVIDRIRDLP